VFRDLNGAERNGNPETSRVCIGISATLKSRYTKVLIPFSQDWEKGSGDEGCYSLQRLSELHPVTMMGGHFPSGGADALGEVGYLPVL
jgi:hypothetical protein